LLGCAWKAFLKIKFKMLFDLVINLQHDQCTNEPRERWNHLFFLALRHTPQKYFDAKEMNISFPTSILQKEKKIN